MVDSIAKLKSILTPIEILDSVTSIGKRSFNNCSSLKTIKVASKNPKYYSFGNCIIEKASKTLICGCGSSVIPDDVTSIGDYAFKGCKSLTKINIPLSVTRIGEYAFAGCTSLTSINVPDSVISIGEGAFDGCSSLTKLIIPDGVKYKSFDLNSIFDEEDEYFDEIDD